MEKIDLDPFLRCRECQLLIHIDKIKSDHSCVCGCKSFRNVSHIISTDEYDFIMSKDPSFIEKFEMIGE